jgi:hypothetical protein
MITQSGLTAAAALKANNPFEMPPQAYHIHSPSPSFFSLIAGLEKYTAD